MLKQLLNGARGMGCREHDYGYAQSVDADPEFRQMCNKFTGRGDWRTYSYPCHNFYRCGNCGHIKITEEHSWGSTQSYEDWERLSEDYLGERKTFYIQKCTRTNCVERRPA